MFLDTKRILLIATGLIILLLVGAFIYLELKVEKTPKSLLSGEEKIYLRPSEEGATPTFIRSETAVCNSETYIFDTVFFEDKGYFNDIYKTAKSQENFIARLKASTLGGDVFFVLATPKKDCDRIYLTKAKYETDLPLRGIFEWRIGEKEFSELLISKEFASNFVPYYPQEGQIAPISSDGEKIIVAKPANPNKENLWCDHRLLYLINLREDTSQILLQLVETETFDNGTSDLDCNGLNLGWIDNTTIYYDVYDATISLDRPFLERRTLKIE